MDDLLSTLLEAAKPHLAELVTVLLTAGLAWLRARVQSQAAEAATLDVELAHRARKREDLALLPGEQRKQLAIAKVEGSLGILARPLTRKGMEKLVEKRVRRAHELADEAEAEA